MERSDVMCEYCKNLDCNDTRLPNQNKHSEIIIEKDNQGVSLNIDYDENFGYSSMYYRDYIYINYCPMCGKKLIKE